MNSPLRHGDALIVGGAEAAIFAIADYARAEFVFSHLGRAIGGAVVHDDGFKTHISSDAPVMRGTRAGAPSGSN